MEDIEDFLSETQRKINRLNDFIVLSLRRKQRSRELCVLTEKAIAVKDHMISAHRIMQEETNQLEEDYENVMTEMRRKQMLVMQFIIREKQRKIKEDQEEERKVQLVLSCTKNRPGSAVKTTTASATKSTMKLLGSHLSHLNLGGITPRLKISDYKDSPLAKKKIIPIPIQFAEFDVQITQAQFDKIPKYMVGRESLDQLNGFLETVIIPCFNEKYQLLHKQRQCLRNNDVDLWKMYKDQESYIPGKNFITPGDITRVMNRMLDKKTQNRLTMLRHIGILHEQRVKQAVCYVWAYNGY